MEASMETNKETNKEANMEANMETSNENTTEMTQEKNEDKNEEHLINDHSEDEEPAENHRSSSTEDENEEEEEDTEDDAVLPNLKKSEDLYQELIKSSISDDKLQTNKPYGAYLKEKNHQRVIRMSKTDFKKFDRFIHQFFDFSTKARPILPYDVEKHYYADWLKYRVKLIQKRPSKRSRKNKGKKTKAGLDGVAIA